MGFNNIQGDAKTFIVQVGDAAVDVIEVAVAVEVGRATLFRM